MLTSLQIKNFKAWKNTGPVRLAPLTVIFGANSAGKSSLGQLLLALKQTAGSTDRKRALNLGDATTFIDLGTFRDCLHGHNLEASLGFHMNWTVPDGLHLKDPLVEGRTYNGDRMSLEVSMTANDHEQPEVNRIAYSLRDATGEILDATFSRPPSGGLELSSRNVQLIESVGRKWPLEAPEKFYRISETSRARFQNAGFLADFALETDRLLDSLNYLGPLRDQPRRTYSWSGNTPEGVGMKGEETIAALLAASGDGRKINKATEQGSRAFAEFIAERLVQLGIIHSFRVSPIAKGRKEYEVLVKTRKSSPEVKLTDVGVGVSQVLPAVVLPFYCKPESIIWMEQPEIHLHPRVQAELADVFITAIQAFENGRPRNVQLVIESHSEHFLNRLQRRIAEGSVNEDQVAIHFCHDTADGNELQPLRLNEFGDIENWPDHFFGDEMADLTARTVAAMEKRKKLAAP